MTNPKSRNRGKVAPAINKQGQPQDGFTSNPKTQLEQKAKTDNTKI
ncbi:hypothetical protein [Calidifontibacillus oryziterrae]|nr:hypothetical protein [Calidifontibacillus oryziterrae]